MLGFNELESFCQNLFLVLLHAVRFNKFLQLATE